MYGGEVVLALDCNPMLCRVLNLDWGVRTQCGWIVRMPDATGGFFPSARFVIGLSKELSR